MSIAKAKTSIRKQGKCAFCGGPFAAHRLIDAQMGRVAAGDPIAEVAGEYHEQSVEAMVQRWAALAELLHGKVLTAG